MVIRYFLVICHESRRVLTKALCGEAPPRSQTPHPFKYRFWQERHPFCIPYIEKWYPFHIPSLELCIHFNCCTCTVFKTWINHETRTFSILFHSHIMYLLVFLGLFTNREDRFPSYTLSCKWPMTLNYQQLTLNYLRNKWKAKDYWCINSRL